MRISYTLFKEAINFICKREKQYEQLNKIIRNFDPDSYILGDTEYSLLVQKLLVEATNDKYDYISYFMWDLDFGRKWKPGTITEADGTDIPLGTIKDLWKLLESTYQENEAQDEKR